MEPRPDGRGKHETPRGSHTKPSMPQWCLILFLFRMMPQWSPGLMAGGSGRPDRLDGCRDQAAMEPRPDGRGKGP